LQRLGRLDEAREQFRQAAEQTSNASQRRVYLSQAEAPPPD
jgi:predicted RNA polymerase sigma factor